MDPGQGTGTGEINHPVERRQLVVVDSLGSIAADAPINALYNLAFLALFVVPLMKRQASRTEAAS